MSETAAVVARAFTSAVLGERVVVRLSQAQLAAATDTEMDVLGFVPRGEAVPVGEAPRKALGFPTWALVHHPEEARFALAVLRDLRKAGARVRTKPGHARDAFVAIAETLARSVPAFLPSFWEEAARAFLAEEATALAAQCFERARVAERAYGLAIDEERRAEVYLEMTIAGAVSVKSLAAYADDLVAAYGADEAERRFRTLNVLRIEAGLEPWAGLPKALRRLAKLAKRDERTADEAFLLAVIDAPSLGRASNEFWSAYLPALQGLALVSPRVRARLLWLFPHQAAVDTFVSRWLALLSALDAVAVVLAEGRGAAWLTRLTSFVTTRFGGPTPPALPAGYFALLEQLAPALATLGEPVRLASGQPRDEQPDTYELDVLEAALSSGVPVAPPKHGRWQLASIDLRRTFTRDPACVAKDAVFGPLLVTAVDRVFGGSAFEQLAAGKRALEEARRLAFERRVTWLAQGGLETMSNALAALEEVGTEALFAEFPACTQRLGEIVVARTLARSLRTGVLDELCWPAFERALDELGPKDKQAVEIAGLPNHPLVRCGPRVLVFHGAERIAERQLPADLAGSPHTMAWLDGELLLEYRPAIGDTKAIWLDRPDAPFVAGLGYAIRDALDVALPAEAGGGTFLGVRPVHRGDALTSDGVRPYVTDGERFWRIETFWADGGQRVRLLELDVRTGKTGRASWPAFVAGATEATDGLTVSEIALRPVAPGGEGSRLGTKDGLHGVFVRRNREGQCHLGRIDGLERTASTPINGLVSLPHATAPTALRVGRAWHANTDEEVSFVDEEGHPTLSFGGKALPSAGLRRVPRFSTWPLLTARDEAGSAALRGTDDAAAQAILEAATRDLGPAPLENEDDRGSLVLPPTPATEATLRATLPTLTDDRLRQSVAQVARQAARLQLRLDALGRLAAGAKVIKGPDDETVKRALFLHDTRTWGHGSVVADLVATGAFLRGGPITTLTSSSVSWNLAIELWPKLLCFLASRGSLPEEARATCRALLEGVVASDLLGATIVRATLSVARDAPLAKRPNHAQTWLYEGASTRAFVRSLDDHRGGTEERVEILALGPAPFAPPTGATIDGHESAVVPAAEDFVKRFLEELAARGPAPYDEAVALAATVPGSFELPDAVFFVAGFPFGQGPAYAHDFLGKSVREALGLRVKDAVLARDRLRAHFLARDTVAGGARRSFFARALDVATPAAFWAEASDPDGLAQTIARAARATFTSEPAVPEALVEAADRELSTPLAARDLLTLLVDPASLQRTANAPISFKEIYERRSDLRHVAQGVASLLPWLSGFLPAADPLLDALIAVVQRVRESLARPGQLFGIGQLALNEPAARRAFLAQLGGETTTIELQNDYPPCEGRDAGLVLALDDGRWCVRLAFRPALVGGNEAQLRSLDEAANGGDVHRKTLAAAVLFLLSSGTDARLAELAARRKDAGSWLADPRITAAAAVAELAARHALSNEAATLYLQTLALAQPTQKLVLAWNGWTKAVYETAAAELVERGLVVEGKRERAGRTIFLPGGWEKLGDAFVESWKKPALELLAGTAVLPGAFGEGFEQAVARLRRGDAPRFEETKQVLAASKQKKKKGTPS